MAYAALEILAGKVREDLEWFFGESGVARVFPDAYDEFVGPIPASERCDPISAYHRRIHGSDQDVAVAWAQTWLSWGDRDNQVCAHATATSWSEP